MQIAVKTEKHHKKQWKKKNSNENSKTENKIQMRYWGLVPRFCLTDDSGEI